MSTLPDLSSPLIQAGLYRLEALRFERKIDLLECVRGAYDVIAEASEKAGAALTDSVLEEQIPDLVIETSLERKWIDYPLCRREVRTQIQHDAYIEGSEVTYFARVRIPQSELVGRIGRFDVPAGYRERFVTNILLGRVLAWKARIREWGANAVPSESASAPSKVDTAGPTSGREVIAANINRLRHQCGWTLEKLAEMVDLDKRNVSRHVSRGPSAKGRPSSNNIIEYAKAFSIELGRTVDVTEIDPRTRFTDRP